MRAFRPYAVQLGLMALHERLPDWRGAQSPYAKLRVLEMVESVARGCCALHGLVVHATDWERLKYLYREMMKRQQGKDGWSAEAWRGEGTRAEREHSKAKARCVIIETVVRELREAVEDA